MKNKTWLIISILLLAILIRFIGLENLSPPMNRDEAAIGYNAYSLLETGRDEHGSSWPLAFKSIGDWKMPGYIYLTMLPVKILGLTVLATRFWSALAGVIAVVLLGLIVKQLSIFKQKKWQEWLSLLAMFLLAINPWHIHYSRIGFEANVNLTLFLLALCLFLKGLKKPIYFLGSSLALVMMQFTYSSSFIFLPIFALALLIIYWPELAKFKSKPILWLSLFILIIGSSLAFLSVLSVSKAKGNISVLASPTTLDTFNHERVAMQKQNPLFAMLWMNKPFYMGRIIASNYVKIYTPEFLFKNQNNHPWHIVVGHGYFYLVDGILLLVGLGYLIKNLLQKNKNKKVIWLLLAWLVISPAASMITLDAPHATRSLYLIPILILIISIGAILATNFLASLIKIKQTILIYILVLVYLVFLNNFVYTYIYKFPSHYADSLLPGIDEAIAYVVPRSDESLIYFNKVSASPYIYVLFYTQMDPDLVQNQAKWKGADAIGLSNIEVVDNYRFIEDEFGGKGEYYFVMQDSHDQPNLNLEKEIKAYKKILWQVYKN